MPVVARFHGGACGGSRPRHRAPLRGCQRRDFLALASDAMRIRVMVGLFARVLNATSADRLTEVA